MVIGFRRGLFILTADVNSEMLLLEIFFYVESQEKSVNRINESILTLSNAKVVANVINLNPLFKMVITIKRVAATNKLVLLVENNIKIRK